MLRLEVAGPADRIGLTLNGRALEGRAVDDSGLLEATIAQGMAGELVDRLVIEWDGEPTPIGELAASSPGDRAIGQTGAALAAGVSLGVRSAGEETGDFAHIYVNGIDFAPNERGYNLVALTDGGEVLDAQAFDTHASPEASKAMAAWLEQWPAGTVIAGAVADEASLSLQEEAVQALATLGVGTDLRGKFRWGHAFAGVAGAEAGTALEEAGLIRPADVSIGPPLDAPAATGGVGAIEFRASD